MRLAEAPTSETLLPRLKILVLDDDLDFCQYLEDLLADDGHQIHTANEPETFWQLFSKHPPDLVLLDMKMGAVRGEEILAELLRRDPELCVIVLTGFPDLATMRTTFQLGVFDYVAKPFSLRQLREAIQRAVEMKGLGKNPLTLLRERLGHRIKILRAERRWGLKDLAEHSGISISQLSSIERGVHLPSVDALYAISKAFNKKISVLLGEIDF